MPVRGECVDVRRLHVHGKNAEALDPIHNKVIAPRRWANLADGEKIRPKAGEELNEADREQPGAPSGFVDPVQGVGGGEPFDVNSLRLKPSPGILVSGKLLLESHNLVSFALIDAHGDGREPLGGILHESDFLVLPIHQSGGGTP